MTIYILTFIITAVVEFAILWLLTRQQFAQVLLYSFLINALTQPIATYVFQNMLHVLWAVELAVVLVESVLIVLLFRLKYGRALLFSSLANLATTLIGFVWFGRR